MPAAVSVAAATVGAAARPLREVALQFVTSSSFHVLVETALLAAIVLLLFQRSFKPQKKPLTEEEIDTLCAEWQPEPLVPPLSEEQRAFKPPVVTGRTGPHVQLAGGVEALNMVSFNFLGLAGHADVQAACAAAISKYGVGSCGPRGFYGTIDVHLELEEALRAYMGTEDAMIYSYDVATPASTIPAFAKRGDLLVVDEGVNFALQSGITLSRSEVRYFKHNDVGDLRRVLEGVRAEDAAAQRSTPLNRRFILVEGLYANYGDLAPLGAIAELKRAFCFRLLVDESLSFGALPGETARGAGAYAGLQPQEVEIVTSSLGNTLGSVGGFCVGSKQVISHQRINASGYCFSASLPPYLASGALKALQLLGEQPQLRSALGRNAAALRAGLACLRGVRAPAGPDFCPLVHLRLAAGGQGAAGEWQAAEALLQRVCDRCLRDHSVLLATAKYSALERARPPPSIRIAVSAAHSDADIRAVLAALHSALSREGVQ